MQSDSTSSGSVPSLPLTSCVLPTPAPPTNMMGLRRSIMRSRKKRSEDVSAVGTNTVFMLCRLLSKSTSVTSSAQGWNFCVLALTK